MPWYEFTLKRFAYFRQMEKEDKRQWYHTRFIAYRTAISFHSAPHPSWFGTGGIDRFLTLDVKAIKKAGEEQRANYLSEYAEYLRIKNSKK